MGPLAKLFRHPAFPLFVVGVGLLFLVWPLAGIPYNKPSFLFRYYFLLWLGIIGAALLIAAYSRSRSDE